MTHVPQPSDPGKRANPYILPVFALIVLAGGIGFGLLERPAIPPATAKLTPVPPTYAEALKEAERADAAAAKASAFSAMKADGPRIRRTDSRPLMTAADRPAHAPSPAARRAPVPLVVVSVKPQYPPLARQNRIEGPVEVALKVDTRGRPTDIQAVSGPPALQTAAVQAAEQWRFKPAGAPSDFRIRFDFKLS